MENTNSADSLAGRILTHGELCKQPERGKTGKDNESFFRADFSASLLDLYKGTSVLYWKGILCGQGENPQELIERAANYYGESNLSVYVVPEKEEELDSAVAHAYYFWL
jgi:hypothetical protein